MGGSPDTSESDRIQRELLEEQKRKLAEQKAEIESRKYLSKNNTSGRGSLVSGAETGVSGSTGVPSRSTLG